MEKVAGKERVILSRAITSAEDFSFFSEKIPSFYFFIGGKPLGKHISETADHHTPEFYIDESGMLLGVKTFIQMSLDYLNE
jgi:amidohydrolase